VKKMKNILIALLLALVLAAGSYAGTAFAQTNDVVDTGEEADGAVDVGENAQDDDDMSGEDSPTGAPQTGLGGMAGR
jgi:hypothetical protein